MYQSGRRILNHSAGFTLLDALFQLVVFSLFAQILLLFIILIQQWNNSLLSNENANWEAFVHDFQQYLKEVDQITINNQSMTIQYSNSSKPIQLNKSSDVIWLQIDNKGYIPLLLGVQQAHFSITDYYLTIRVEFVNGIVKERVLFVQYD